ncbi:MAG: DUF4157 domain-containing protein [Bacteroidetes bacterium]|nr:DUF4157 domain-containing protein [Bacteroidota bacterium]
MNIFIKEKSVLAHFAAIVLKEKSMALTLGRTIHLWHTHDQDFLKNQKWLQHELIHVRQFEKAGYLVFIFQYIWECIRHGYVNNKFEKAARLGEGEAMDLKKYNFICHKK